MARPPTSMLLFGCSFNSMKAGRIPTKLLPVRAKLNYIQPLNRIELAYKSVLFIVQLMIRLELVKLPIFRIVKLKRSYAYAEMK